MSDAPKKLFLLDGFALIYRAFFALNRPNKDGTTSLVSPNFRNSKGLNVSTMMTFTNTLIQVLQKEKPSHIAFVLDTPAATMRHDKYPEYKANRPPMPEDLRLAVPYVIRIVEAFNIPIIKLDGFEADDLIGTLAKQAEKEDFEVFMMTPDKDYAQLITDKVKMFRPGRSGGDVEIWDIEKVQDKFKVERTEQVIDFLGMMGDKVDNIPGIPGVGEKTAQKFLAAYGSMEGLYENLEDLKGKMKEKVEANRELAFLSKDLATIVVDAPVSFDEAGMRTPEMNRDAVREVFTELEFRTLTKRVLGEDVAIKPAAKEDTNGQMDLFGGGGNSAGGDADSTMRSLETVEHNYHFCDTAEKRAELIKILSKSKTFCFDTETTGVDAMIAELVGMSFAVKPGEAWYVPVPEDKVGAQAIVDEFKALFEGSDQTKVGQNVKYDMTMLRHYGVRVQGPLFDTMLAHYLLEPDRRHNMDILAERYLNYTTVSITTLIGKKGKNQKSMRDIPQEDICDYACEDADITLQLMEKFEPLLAERGVRELFDTVETPLIPVLADMEYEGIRLDSESLNKLSADLSEDLVGIREKIYEAAGGEFLITSPKQVGEVLFDKLKVTDKPQKTATGQYKTSEDVLVKLKDKHEIIEHILKFRELTKLKNTYVDVLPTLVNPNSGRIHTTFNQVVAATGRLSSDNPNIQNIPVRTERGREVRKAFVVKDEDHVLLACDYSQIELRIIAQISGDEGMREAFSNDFDIHSSTAAKVFGVELDEVTRDMRSKAKAVNFGIAYGQGAFGLAQTLNIPRREAKEIIENYFEQFPGIRGFMDNVVENAREKGYCETIMGRRRYLRDINSPNAVDRKAAERLAVNAPIQGSAADMIKVAMIRIHEVFKERQFKSRMLLQVHDELVFDAHRDELDTIIPLVQELMQDAIAMEVPIKVDAGTGKDWLEAH